MEVFAEAERPLHTFKRVLDERGDQPTGVHALKGADSQPGAIVRRERRHPTGNDVCLLSNLA